MPDPELRALYVRLGLIPPPLPEDAADYLLCSKCGTRMKAIMYGFPTSMPDDDDDYVLGGCVVSPMSPRFTCPQCKKP